jgi:Tfp pilus assembly protein PilX
VVVFIALIVLVAMTLAGIAMMRASGNAILTAGNLGFRHGALVAGDLALESARAWLKAPGKGPVTLETRDPANGYYATWNDLEPPLPAGEPFDPLLWAYWKDPAKAVQVNGGGFDAAGNRVSYVIHRMCAVKGTVSGPGAAASQECVTTSAADRGGPKESGTKSLAGTSQTYYRITARIEGPKNTVSYVQTMVY